MGEIKFVLRRRARGKAYEFHLERGDAQPSR